MSKSMDWQPSATLAMLHQRSDMMAKIRDFFRARDVLEVETPAMSLASITDIHLQTFTTEFFSPEATQGKTLYLQTSPEFHMKRLLAAGYGAIFQLSRAFRNEEAGRHHNPEFTMLEWYRPGFDHFALMDEVAALIVVLLGCGKPQSMSYQQAFLTYLEVDPLDSSMQELKAAGEGLSIDDLLRSEVDRDTLLQLLFVFGIEPNIGHHVPLFIYHFPASQAALARIDSADPRVAQRFELYFGGIELANGFYELSDADEQLARFEADNAERQRRGRSARPVDYHLIEALKVGLPDCAGVALGLDRVLMLATGAKHIQEVLAFDVRRA